MHKHWDHFGRHYYSRHDYESIASDIAQNLYETVELRLPSLIGNSFAGRQVTTADNFTYTDPVDHSITARQGLRILLDDGSRVILRLSGTGTKGATLRVYLESYVSSQGDLTQNPQNALSQLITSIDSFAEISNRTGMSRPTVIT
ncbi:Phosphoglucomutase [Prochlorococcus marinus str. SS2]|nr:Phosphoglucomutase [Prochlorococcus marinus str. SS2]